MISPLPSTIVATTYVFFVTILSCIQFRRSQTPLRLGAAVMAVIGLSISALSVVYAADKLSLSVFWIYQFVAECIAVTWVITTIIHLGYAFYPLTRHQTLIWRTALGSVILYDLVALAELSYYCYAVWGTGMLVKEATPVLGIYWARQLVKVLACAVTIAYLFIPLIRHHSTGLAIVADSNTLAVGTWYLNALSATFLGYTSMFIYYMTKPDEVFSPQAQALDLCIRLLVCPIFSLPPPPFLLRYFQTKNGFTIRDDNPNTMIEEGITNDPRPRRPPMLVIQPSAFSSRRNEDGAFNPPVYQGRRYGEDFQWPYDLNDDRFNPTMDKERDVGTVYSADTTSVTIPGPNATGPNTTFTPRENQTPAVVVADDIVAMSLAITTPPADAFLSQNSQESSPMTPLISFAFGLPCRNDEYEKTVKAARKISRRLTMEGRRDGLDFLNIGGLMKWPHGTSSITPTPAPKSAGMEPHITSAAKSPAIITAAHFLVSRRDHNDLLECSSSTSTDMRDMLSIIGNSFMAEEEDKDGEIENGVTACSIDRPVDATGLQSLLMCMSKGTIARPIELHACLDASEIHRNYDLHTTLKSQGKDNTQIQSSSSNTLSSLSGKLSMDNICQPSCEALTRLQEEGIEAILGTTLPTVPLSLATLQTTRSKSSGDHGDGISATDLGDADRVHTDASKISMTSALVDKAQQLHASVE